MKVGVIGAGQVGVALGANLAAAGHSVRYGSRDPSGRKGGELAAALAKQKADVGSIHEVSMWADAVLLTVTSERPGPALHAFPNMGWTGLTLPAVCTHYQSLHRPGK